MTERLALLQELIASDPLRMRVLDIVRDLGLPDCWVAAGFVRNRVWNHAHGRPAAPLQQDVDVIWFDADDCLPERDAALEDALRQRDPTLAWSVKNQARMHLRNEDAPYRSVTDAMRYWPETATAVGVRLGPQCGIEVASPYGLADLFDLVVRPTERFRNDKPSVYMDRLRAKEWGRIWPELGIELLT